MIIKFDKTFFRHSINFSLGLFMLALAACNSGGGSSGPENGIEVKLASACGTVSGGDLQNPVSKAVPVEVVAVASSNSLIIRETSVPAQGNILVKLHGLQAATTRASQAVSLLKTLASGGAYFIPAGENCNSTVEGGGLAQSGQLFTLDGKNYTEELLTRGLGGAIESTGTCNESSVASCYSAMKEANAIKSAGEITDFLWKPAAESPYNRGNPVIHANPCNATVYVNGNALIEFGPGNGRCNTSRMFSSCSSFGTNIKVEIIDNETGLPYFNGPDPFVIVPNGCSRYEFKR